MRLGPILVGVTLLALALRSSERRSGPPRPPTPNRRPRRPPPGPAMQPAMGPRGPAPLAGGAEAPLELD